MVKTACEFPVWHDPEGGKTQTACEIKRGGAGDRTRTRDPLFTKQPLYQLSYAGDTLHIIKPI